MQGNTRNPTLIPCAHAVDPSWDEYHEKRITLGGLVEHLAAIRRGRRVMFVACGTSFHACLACRQTVEELAEVPVRPRRFNLKKTLNIPKKLLARPWG